MLVKLLGNPDISQQKVLDLPPCLQGIQHCPLHREQRGSSTQCQSSSSGFCLAHLVDLLVKVTAATPDFLTPPLSIGGCGSVLLWCFHSQCTEVASVFSAFKPHQHHVLDCQCPFLPPSASFLSLFLPSHPVSSCATEKTRR